MKFARLTHVVLPLLLASASLIPLSYAQTEPGIVEGFQNPPNSARPRVWWHWMNGNITKDGIQKDIEWMSRVGIGGLQNFDAALETPQIVDRRLVYMTPEWKDAFRYAAGLAEQHGLEMTVAASPGWSETGGPWVEPKDGMKKLVWSETVVTGGRRFSGALAAPSDVTGPFHDIPFARNLAASDTAKAPPKHYADVAVIAYRMPSEAAPLPAARFTASDGKAVNGAVLSDMVYGTGADVPRGTATEPSFVTIDFGAPQTVRSLNLAIAGAAALFQGPSLRPRLEVSEGAGKWRAIADIPLDGGVQTTVSFAPVRARTFRVVFPSVGEAPDPGFLGFAPGAVLMSLFQANEGKTIRVSELRLTGAAQVDRFEVKAGFGTVPSYVSLPAAPEASGVPLDAVVDLTGKMSADGKLDWTPPAGRWKIIRFGASLVGTVNHPATVEATGLEVDKFDGPAVRRYLETYIGMMKDAAGADLVGAKGLRAILTDSIEVGASNWTPELVAQFKRLRGYDPTPWMPALTGVVIGSAAQTDAFLYDFRQTLADLITSEHYGTVAKVAHEHGLKVYGEALEAGRPSLGDDMAMRSHADIPMAALWTWPEGRGPRMGLLGDMKGASSVAHIYGQNLAAAESMTAAFSPWAFSPWDLKPVIDLEFAYGINRPVVHTSVHQPVDDKTPGLSLGPFGQYFNRHDTWAEMAKPWVDYLSRNAFMLQQGRDFADVAYFYGEDAPLSVLYDNGPPADTPREYAFDFVNADALRDRLKVDGTDLVSPSGARYRVVFLGASSRQMTLPVLKRFAELAEQGATIVGPAPTASLGLKDDQAEFKALVSRLWAGGASTTVGKGRVIAATDVSAALKSMDVAPDFVAGGDSDVLFVHRRLADGDAYFLSNRRDQAASLQARFRVTGKAPEIWRAETGVAEPVSYRVENGVTTIALDMTPHDSFYVVFRKPSSRNAVTVKPKKWETVKAISGAWDVKFQEGRGAPAQVRFDTLQSFAENADPGVKYFSGVATYRSTIEAPRARRGQRYFLDLGKIGDVAEVVVNGRSAGFTWKAPYRVDVGGLLRPGRNDVEIRVANLWVNRLIGDAQPGANKITYTSLPTYRPDAPLRPSGLLGPVTLVTRDE